MPVVSALAQSVQLAEVRTPRPVAIGAVWLIATSADTRSAGASRNIRGVVEGGPGDGAH